MDARKAFEIAFGWTGGSYHQMDTVLRLSLDDISKHSLEDLRGMDDWIDLIIAANELQPTAVKWIREAYLLRWSTDNA